MHRNIFARLLLGSLLLGGTARAAEFDHSVWDTLLKQQVEWISNGSASEVNYIGMANDRAKLAAYLGSLSAVSQSRFDAWSNPEQLAFLINAYNAWTVELILTKYPQLHSIKELGSILQSPWKKPFILLLGKKRSLDDIEHNLIRGSGNYNEPRIHFALNCASIGCPALRPEAFTSSRLAVQLDAATRSFLSDRSRNRLRNGVLEVSSIFKWYRKDFERGWQGYRSLQQFFADYAKALGLTAADVRNLQAKSLQIEFLDYDWRLNGVKQ